MHVTELGASSTLFYRYSMAKKIPPSLDLLAGNFVTKRIQTRRVNANYENVIFKLRNSSSSTIEVTSDFRHQRATIAIGDPVSVVSNG
jgi:hypothetical protein